VRVPGVALAPAGTRYDLAVVAGPLSIAGSFGTFADQLLRIELPDLPDAARQATVEFVCRRANQVPTPLRLGVTGLSLGVGAAQRALGVERTTRLLQNNPLPFVGELARMVRSLGFAYVWETWPDTSPTGAPTGMAA
jgi:hypothetical protein